MTPDSPISVRFGDRILERGFTAIPNLVLDTYSQLGISESEMLFIIHVWQYWWNEKNPYPSLSAIAQKMGTTRRTTRRHVESLKRKGLLIVRERVGSGIGKMTNEYDFSPLIEAVVTHTSPHRTFLSYALGTELSDGHRTGLSSEEEQG